MITLGLTLQLRDLVLFAELVAIKDAFIILQETLSIQCLSITNVVFVAHNVFNLINMHQVDLAESLMTGLATQTELTLVEQEELDVEEAPRDEFPRQALISAVANLPHKALVLNVFVVGGEPHVILLALNTPKKFKWVARLECD